MDMDLFGNAAELRMTMQDAIDLTVESLNEHGAKHRHWTLSWSGGKDSTATLTLLLHLFDTGRVDAPRTPDRHVCGHSARAAAARYIGDADRRETARHGR